MNIFDIQSLIAQGKIGTLSDFDPLNSYVQLGVYQKGNRRRGAGDLNTYAPYALPLSEIVKTCGDSLGFKVGSIGPKVSFSKKAGSDPNIFKDKIIPGKLEITRGNNNGIYNIAVEGSFNSGVSPQDTTWNTQIIDANNTSWSGLGNINTRTYDTWFNGVNLPSWVAAPQYVGMPAIMKYTDPVTSEERYWLIMFTKWGVGRYGEAGEFAYDRYEIYPAISFVRPDYSSTIIDKISDEVYIARKDDGGGIYNILDEPEFEGGVSPRKTKWNSSYIDSRPGYSGFSNLSNLENRVYGSFVQALDGSVGNNIIGTELIMHDLTTDLYWKFVFTQWTSNGNGGGFEYTRQVVPQSCPIKFGDGSVMTTAAIGGGSGVQSVTGLNTDNTDPLNPVVQISVDGLTITGDGTPGNPLVSSGSGLPAWLEYNASDLTIWNNGMGNLDSNTSYGKEAFASNTSGQQNTAIGTQSLYSNTGGNHNTAIGNKALRFNTNTSFNTAIGTESLYTNNGGEYNVAISYQSLYSNTTGSKNIGIGMFSGYSNSTGDDNVAIGYTALSSNTIGAFNVAIGTSSLSQNTVSNNIGIGYLSMPSNTTGNTNIAIGNYTLNTNTTGRQNIAIGYESMYFNTIGGENIAIGVASLYINSTGSNNVAIGLDTLRTNTTGSNNTAIGVSVLQSNTTGIDNTAIGFAVGNNNTTGYENVFIGTNTALDNTIGYRNIFIGFEAASIHQTGDGNIGIGYRVAPDLFDGFNNIIFGYETGIGLSSGIGNVILGNFISNSGDYSNSIAIGESADITASNQLVVGSSATPVGTITTTGSLTQTHTWTVRINGANYKIPLELIP